MFYAAIGHVIVLTSVTTVVGGKIQLNAAEHNRYEWMPHHAAALRRNLTSDTRSAVSLLKGIMEEPYAHISAENNRGIVYDRGKTFVIEYDKPGKPELAGSTNLNMWMQGTRPITEVPAGAFPYTAAYEMLALQVNALRRELRAPRRPQETRVMDHGGPDEVFVTGPNGENIPLPTR